MRIPREAVITLAAAIGILAFALVLWFAIPSLGPSAQHTQSDAVAFWHDDLRGVGCWVYRSGYRGGISCLPDGQYSR